MHQPPSSRTSAFTLLEILLVLLVISIAVGAFLPTAMNTADQARTRSFLRQLIALNQYARSRAVLDVTPMTLSYDLDQGVVLLQKANPSAGMEPDLLEETTVSDDDLEPVSDTVALMQRTVPSTMRIRSIEGASERDGIYSVTIEADGVGPSYEIEVIDPRGEPRRLKFNGFTGEVDEVE